MSPFFCFYGGKWRAAPRYPKPAFSRIIEPFAGAAGYSTRYHDRDIVLVERDPIIAAMWRYLIAALPEDILALPLIDSDQTLGDLDCRPEAKSLIGFWLNKGTASPCNKPSKWMRSEVRPNSFWSPSIRERVASQVNQVKHWTVIEGDYTDAPREEATYFIDPPYQVAGVHYRCSSKQIDFDYLGSWCRELPGQVMVCENDGADWLPFHSFREIKGMTGSRRIGSSKEVLWQSFGESQF